MSVDRIFYNPKYEITYPEPLYEEIAALISLQRTTDGKGDDWDFLRWRMIKNLIRRENNNTIRMVLVTKRQE